MSFSDVKGRNGSERTARYVTISKEVFNQLKLDTQNTFEWIGSSKIKGSEKLVSLHKFVDEKTEKSFNKNHYEN